MVINHMQTCGKYTKACVMRYSTIKSLYNMWYNSKTGLVFGMNGNIARVGLGKAPRSLPTKAAMATSVHSVTSYCSIETIQGSKM